MDRIAGISVPRSRRPEDVVVTDVTAAQPEQQRLDCARRWKQLLAHVRTSRADFERETQSRRRLLAALEPQRSIDPLLASIEAAWQRLSIDYHKSRKVAPYVGRKWQHG
ncbi:hypothetical protein HFO84_32085 [Rhizobium leguminosarum]|uniref:hypothetical protein n=1 Tax=Rhizobium leguminosarum TaxID=384 RepID=UPI001C976D85|nr:hypothetical protein [Rhizobium leguminosarum]MBY5481928.1 hypothetical protein [Rhizobium leguminosarum]